MTAWPVLTVGARPVSVTSVPLTATAPTASRAPSVAVTVKAPAGGAFAAVASSASSKTIVSVAPAAGTLAETGSGATMSSVVASSASDAGPVASELIAETR